MNQKHSMSTFVGRLFMFFIFVFLYAPIVVVMFFSFNEGSSNTVFTGFSLKWYQEVFESRTVMKSLYTTLTVAGLSTLIATVVGTFAAIGFHNMKRKWRKPLMTINNIPMMNADIITGVSLALFLVASFQFIHQFTTALHENTGGAIPILKPTTGFATLLIAHICFNIPYVILSITPRLRQMDKHLVDAAQDLGCTWFMAFYRVILPELKSGIINGMLIAFTMSMDDFVISYFTAGTSVSTLSMVIYGMTKRRITPQINAISTLLFVIVLLLLIIINVHQIAQEKKRAKLENL